MGSLVQSHILVVTLPYATRIDRFLIGRLNEEVPLFPSYDDRGGVPELAALGEENRRTNSHGSISFHIPYLAIFLFK